MTYEGKRFLVIDGSSLAYRAFYALPLLSNRQGVYTNAVYGFLTMFFKILDNEKFDYVAVAFDKGRITFRNEHYPDYKGHRKETPPELGPQFGLIKDILKALRIPNYELDNYEADDLIGTLAREADNQGLECLILTGDRDALQLVSDRIKVLLTRTGISQLDTYDKNVIKDKYGVEPQQLIDVKGLMGDSSDNIPGVPGVGEKTALRLIKEYSNLDNVLANVDKISGPKLRENLVIYKDQALLSRLLATIDLKVPFDFSFEECIYEEPDYPTLLEHYKKLEFNSLVPGVLGKMSHVEGDVFGVEDVPSLELKSLAEFKAHWQKAMSQGPLALELEIDGHNYLKGDLLAVGFSTEEKAMGYTLAEGQLEEVMELLRAGLADLEQRWVLYDAKKTLVFCQRFGQLPQVNLLGDIMLATYLINPSAGQQDFAKIALEHLNIPFVESKNHSLKAADKAGLMLRLHKTLFEQLAETEMLDLYRQIELPLVSVLASMETRGVKLDLGQLDQMREELAISIQEITEKIYLLAGEEFNINSPKQLSVILFDKLGLPPLKKTKTGYSTNAEVLEELAPRHAIVNYVLEYRQLVKLQSTYVEGLKSVADPGTGKVHTTFNQTVTATGRLSSQEPNLQNIPIRLELGRLIRKTFIPSRQGRLIMAADYSQIELRVLAHISGDRNLIEAFMKGQDIHSRTASEVFDVDIDQVTSDMRQQAKAVNFGIVYGISDYGLSRDLGITVKEAGQYIDLYFARYPGVKQYIDQVILKGRERGYVKTLLNRRRYLPDLLSSNGNIRSFGERTAMNTPIQGTAADIIKIAMLDVEAQLKSHDMNTEMILQVHDELIFEVPEEELLSATKLIRGAMENALSLDVPLHVEIKAGPNWYDMEIIEREG